MYVEINKRLRITMDSPTFDRMCDEISRSTSMQSRRPDSGSSRHSHGGVDDAEADTAADVNEPAVDVEASNQQQQQLKAVSHHPRPSVGRIYYDPVK